MCQTCQGIVVHECLESKLLKIEMLNFDLWILKVKNWNLYVKCLESEILKTKMFELGYVNTWSWKFKSLCEASRIWKFEN
jgi:hypothetical protein